MIFTQIGLGTYIFCTTLFERLTIKDEKSEFLELFCTIFIKTTPGKN